MTMDLLLFTYMFSFLYNCKDYLPDLTVCMSNTAVILYEAGTTYASRASEFTARFWWGPCCSSFQFLVLSYCVSVRSELRDVRYDSRIKPIFGSSLSPVVCRRAHVLFTLSVVVFLQWCPTHIVLCFFFVFVASFYGYIFFIAPLVFPNIYLNRQIYCHIETKIIILRLT